jgi:hypothetical protein
MIRRLLNWVDRMLHRPASDETFSYRAPGHYRTRTGRWIHGSGGK